MSNLSDKCWDKIREALVEDGYTFPSVGRVEQHERCSGHVQLRIVMKSPRTLTVSMELTELERKNYLHHQRNACHNVDNRELLPLAPSARGDVVRVHAKLLAALEAARAR